MSFENKRENKKRSPFY